MQVRPSDAAGAAAGTQHLSARNLLALFDLDFREMHIEGEQAVPMIDHHAVAFKVKRARQDYSTGIGGAHGSADGGVIIKPLVLALLHSIVGARRAEASGHGSGHGKAEPSH